MADTMSNVCHMIIVHKGIYDSFMLTPYIFVSSIKKNCTRNVLFNVCFTSFFKQMIEKM